MDRATLDAAVMQNSQTSSTVNARPEVGGHAIQLSRQQFLDLISVHLGDWLQQVRLPWIHPSSRKSQLPGIVTRHEDVYFT